MTYVSADALLSPRSLAALTHPAARASLPRGTAILESGRVALWAALRALRFRESDRLLLPAFICDSILSAPSALGVGVEFFGVSAALEPDLYVIDRLLRDGARAVLLVHYYGFQSPGLTEVRKLCDQHGAFLIEDCAHALYGRDETGQAFGSFGDAAIFSPWKTVPLPDGGIVRLRDRELPTQLSRLPRPAVLTTLGRIAYREVSVVESTVGYTPRTRALRSEDVRRNLQADAAATPLIPRRASATTERLLASVDAAEVVSRRRANWLQIHRTLRGSRWARPLADALPEGVCPLGYALLARDRERARRALLAAGINVRAYWERLAPSASRLEFPQAHELADQILVLPTHQSLTGRDMTHLLRSLDSLEREWQHAS